MNGRRRPRNKYPVVPLWSRCSRRALRRRSALVILDPLIEIANVIKDLAAELGVARSATTNAQSVQRAGAQRPQRRSFGDREKALCYGGKRAHAPTLPAILCNGFSPRMAARSRRSIVMG